MLLRGQGCRSDGLIAIGLPRADEVAVVAHAMLSKRMGDRFSKVLCYKQELLIVRTPYPWSTSLILRLMKNDGFNLIR